MIKGHAGHARNGRCRAKQQPSCAAAVAEVMSDQVDVGLGRGASAAARRACPANGVGGDRRAEAFAAWRRFLEALAERGPLVLVFEDIQWADDGLLDFVDHLVEWATRGAAPRVGTARPELSSAGRLGRREAERDDDLALAAVRGRDGAADRGAPGAPVLPAATQAALLARAGGKPLYAEEYVRMLVGARGPPADRCRSRCRGSSPRGSTPSPSEEKESFRTRPSSARSSGSARSPRSRGLARWTVEERLHALERKEFVRREQRSSVAGETSTPSATSSSATSPTGRSPARAAPRSTRVAEWIESYGRSEEQAELLAHHYLEALEYAKAAGQAAADLAERGRLALRDAGARALDLAALGTAAAVLRGRARALAGGRSRACGGEPAGFRGPLDRERRRSLGEDDRGPRRASRSRPERPGSRGGAPAHERLLVPGKPRPILRPPGRGAAARREPPGFQVQGVLPRPGLAVPHARPPSSIKRSRSGSRRSKWPKRSALPATWPAR